MAVDARDCQKLISTGCLTDIGKRSVYLLLTRLHIEQGETSNSRWCLSSSVTLHGGPAGGFTHAGQAMTSCRLQSNYSLMVTLHGGPVVLRPIRATPCFYSGPVTCSLLTSWKRSTFFILGL